MGVFGGHFTLAWLNVAWLCKNSLKAAPELGGGGAAAVAVAEEEDDEAAGGGRSPSFVRHRLLASPFGCFLRCVPSFGHRTWGRL